MYHTSRITPIIFLLYIVFLAGCHNTGEIAKTDKAKDFIQIEGELKQWHTITLTFDGPEMDENSLPNPFLNYRLEVVFSNGETSYQIPGYFAADGNAAESSATAGNKWRVKFTPDKTGEWTYNTSFRTGNNIAVTDTLAGEPVSFDGATGKFNIEKTDKQAPDFRAKGKLRYVGERYLKFAGSGEYFLKGGTDSPENFLAYEDFDNTPPTHDFSTHADDWQQEDPTWQNGKGKNIIGAVNYLSSKGMNVAYFLTMNVMGDGKDVWMWTDDNERYRFDCSKLDQWDIVFSHMQQKGIMLHFVTQENENQLLLDAGFTDVQRKLYYRELVARYGHHLAITWNMGEESGRASWYDHLGQSDKQRLAMAEHLRKIDPYNNFLVIHTLPTDENGPDELYPFLGKEYLDGPSLQVDLMENAHDLTVNWIKKSADSSRQWVVCLDEFGPWYRGALADSVDAEHDTTRMNILWGNLMAGGAGVEWYMGLEDLHVDDFRTREKLWDQTRYALNFFQQHVDFTNMKSNDQLTIESSDYVFSGNGQYLVYTFDGKGTTLDLSGHSGNYKIQWFNPRSGGELTTGSKTSIAGGSTINIGTPPIADGKDWVALIQRDVD